MLVKRFLNVRMSDGWLWFVGQRTARPCVVWLLLGVVPVFVEQRGLTSPPAPLRARRGEVA